MEALLTYRNDRYWKGWHIPGSVLRPGEKIRDALLRIQKQEVKFSLTKPRFFALEEKETPRGQEVSLIFLSRKKRGIKDSKTGVFFLLTELPKDVIEEHKTLLKTLRSKLRAS